MTTELQALRTFAVRMEWAESLWFERAGKSPEVQAELLELGTFSNVSNPKYDYFYDDEAYPTPTFNDKVYQQDGHTFRIIEVFGGAESNQHEIKVFVQFEGTYNVYVLGNYFSSWDNVKWSTCDINRVERGVAQVELEVFRTESGVLLYETSERFIEPSIKATFKTKDD